MTVVDTSFLLALHHPADRFHRDARAKRLTGDRLLIPWEVWTELCHVLMLRFGAEDSQRTLRSILEGPFEVRNVLSVEDSMAIVAGARSLQAKARHLGVKPFSFFDLVVCAVAARFGEAVLTFDEGMTTAIRQRWFPGARLA